MGSRRVALRSIENSLATRPRRIGKDSLEAVGKKPQRESLIAPIFRKNSKQDKTPRSSIYSLFDDDVPEELSTFFESSTIENPAAKNLKPVFQSSSNDFFPGDDIFKDVPWIGIPSPTYSRRRRALPIKRGNGSDAFGSSSDSAGEEIETAQRPSPRKRRKLAAEEPGFQEWVERTNAELSEAAKHELIIEGT